MSTRTITSPGIQINETDLSLIARTSGETNVFLTGFSNKGPTEELINVSSVSEYEEIFGTPTNAAERYLYHSARQLISTSPANVLLSRMPYGSGGGDGYTNSYSALVYPLSSNASTYATSTQFVVLEPKSILLTNDQYQNILQGGLSYSSGYVATSANAIAGYNDIGNAGIIVLNQSKTTVNNLFEGYYVGLSDNSNANPATDYNSISGIKAANAVIGNSSQSFVNIPLARLGFSLTRAFSAYNGGSVSEIMEAIPTGYDFGSSAFTDILNLIVFKIRPSIYQQDTVTLDYVVNEGYSGSLYSNRTQNNPNGGNPISFALEKVVDSKSSNIKVLVNPNISNSGSWISDSGLPNKTVRVANPTKNLYSVGVYVSNTDKTAKDVGNVPLKLERILRKMEENETIELDFVVEAGLGTVWAGAKARKADAGYSSEPQVFDDTYAVDISVLKDTSGSVVNGINDDYKSILTQFVSFANDKRKDHIFIADPLRYIFVNGSNVKVSKQNSYIFSTDTYWAMKNQFASVASSYVAVYGNWVKINDNNSDSKCWIPASAFAAAIHASSTQSGFPWTAAAGFNRGTIDNILDLGIVPTQKQRDLLYKININPIAFFPNDGFVLYGQKTQFKKPSAFDRINVRRLFLALEKSTQSLLKYYLFEGNTFTTRTRLLGALTPIYEQAKINDGCYDYKLVCDESNNTPNVIDNNEMKLSVYIQPVRTAEFILADFIATRTGVNFDELIG